METTKKTTKYVTALLERSTLVALNRAICKAAGVGRKEAREREFYLVSMAASMPSTDEVVKQLLSETICLLGGAK